MTSTARSVIIISAFITILIVFWCHDLVESRVLHKIFSTSTPYRCLTLDHELSQKLSIFPDYFSFTFSAITS